MTNRLRKRCVYLLAACFIVFLAVGKFADASAVEQIVTCEEAINAVARLSVSVKDDNFRNMSAALFKSCPSEKYPTIAYCMSRKIALTHFEKAIGLSNAGAKPGEVLRTVKAGLRYGKPWQLLFARGEIEQSISRYSMASLAFSAAIDDFSDTNICRDEEVIISEMSPTERVDTAKAMFRNAEYNLLRAKWLPPETKYRCCDAVGSLRNDIRGYIPSERNFRVDFVAQSSRFAQDGEKGLQRLERYLTRRKLNKIALFVHTDDFNDPNLSCRVARARADIIRSYLSGRHSDWTVKVVPVGSTETFTVPGTGAKLQIHLPRISVSENPYKVLDLECKR